MSVIEKKNCHYVPQCYQRAWSTGNDKVYYYEKETKTKFIDGGNEEGYYKVKKRMFREHYYSTTLAVNPHII